MIIRPLRAEDRADWARLWTAYLAFYETTVEDTVFETAFARLLSDDPNQYSALVAERDGALIGLAHFLIHRDLWSTQDTCYLGDLFVDPAARKSGAARALIDQLEADARAKGAATLYWTTQHGNAPARAFYDQIAELTPFVQYSKSLR